MPGHVGIRRFLTKRFIFSLMIEGLATWLCRTGKLSGTEWVYASALVLAGHHAEDWIRAYKGAQ